MLRDSSVAARRLSDALLWSQADLMMLMVIFWRTFPRFDRDLCGISPWEWTGNHNGAISMDQTSSENHYLMEQEKRASTKARSRVKYDTRLGKPLTV